MANTHNKLSGTIKNFEFLSLIILFTALINPLMTDAQAGAGSFLKAKIIGTNWEAEKMVFDKYPSEIVQVWGDKGSTSLRLQLNQPKQGKSDKLIKTDLNSWTDENFNMYMVEEGTTQITKMDDHWIEGTFQMTARDERSGKRVTITTGTFRIPNPKNFKE